MSKIKNVKPNTNLTLGWTNRACFEKKIEKALLLISGLNNQNQMKIYKHGIIIITHIIVRVS